MKLQELILQDFRQFKGEQRINFATSVDRNVTLVFGANGSGKTTLLNGLINECPTVSGKVTVSGKMAYCSQLPWIQNMTVRENILCGEAYDQERYAAAVEACDMSDDMRSFADGDETEIGEVRQRTNASV